MVEKNWDRGAWLTDMDILLDFQSGNDVSWTAPRWIMQGDFLFFYHTKSARSRAASLYQQAVQEYGKSSNLTRVVKHAMEVADQYAGTIFGCAEVSGAVQYDKSELYHFDSRFFASLGQFHIFSSPLSSETFADYIKIAQNTITPLHGQQFEGIRVLLAKHNILPNFLQNAHFGESGFRAVNQDNWPEILCATNARFIHEAQIRAYLLDYLLNEVKDKGTPLLEECQCYRNGDKTGIADYFVKINGQWVPVEAKLNILAEKDILSQIGKYVQIDSLIPTKGSNRTKRFEASKHTVCIVADQSGIYMTLAGQFFRCSPGIPFWPREELNHSTASDIRDWLQERFMARQNEVSV